MKDERGVRDCLAISWTRSKGSDDSIYQGGMVLWGAN